MLSSASVEALASFEPQLVLLEILLGGEIDGIELCRRLKQEQGRHDVKVIVLTMYGECRAEALGAGADLFLVKGGTSEALRAAICSE